MSVLIKDLAKAGDVRDLTGKEMESIRGGEEKEPKGLGGWDYLSAAIDTVTAPFGYDQALEYLKSKSKS